MIKELPKRIHFLSELKCLKLCWLGALAVAAFCIPITEHLYCSYIVYAYTAKTQVCNIVVLQVHIITVSIFNWHQSYIHKHTM